MSPKAHPRAVPCGQKARYVSDSALYPEETVSAVTEITRSAIRIDDAGGFSRPMPAAVRRMLERHLDELEMAHKGLLYEASRSAMGFVER